MLLEKSKKVYLPPGYAEEDGPDGELIERRWRDEQRSSLLGDLETEKSNHRSLCTENVRSVLAEYFYGPGQVP